MTDTLGWRYLKRLGLYQDSASRYNYSSDTPIWIQEYLSNYRSPSRAYPNSYAKALMTKKFVKLFREKDPLLAAILLPEQDTPVEKMKAMEYAKQILDQDNPIVPYELTYAIHDILKAFNLHPTTTGMTYLRYRVHHGFTSDGKPHVTQNIWEPWQNMPTIEEIIQTT
jgi:hypothetical protein